MRPTREAARSHRKRVVRAFPLPHLRLAHVQRRSGVWRQLTLPAQHRLLGGCRSETPLCAELKALGGALLAALEKKDAEQLALLRSGHEMQILELLRDTRQAQVAEAEANIAALQQSEVTVLDRFGHYQKLLGKSSMTKGQDGLPVVEQSSSLSVSTDTGGAVSGFGLSRRRVRRHRRPTANGQVWSRDAKRLGLCSAPGRRRCSSVRRCFQPLRSRKRAGSFHPSVQRSPELGRSAKRTAARNRLHQCSGRQCGSEVYVRCSALPANPDWRFQSGSEPYWCRLPPFQRPRLDPGIDGRSGRQSGVVSLETDCVSSRRPGFAGIRMRERRRCVRQALVRSLRTLFSASSLWRLIREVRAQCSRC